MAGGSIYIDPDSLSHVSSQIGMTAEQLDSLRQTIVPRVNEVISMSYPSIQEMPNIAYPLNSSQDNIEAFNYRTQILVEDLRTTSIKLNQIAEAGRVMNEILLRQTIMFGSTGQGGEIVFDPTLQVPSPWGTVIGDIGLSAGLVTELIHFLSKTDVLLKNRGFQNVARSLDKNSNVKLSIIAFGFITDVLSGKPITLSNVAAELTGNSISAIATDNEVGATIVAIFAAIQLSSATLGGLQGLLAGEYGEKSAIGSALQDTANNLATTSEDADTSKFFDDLGPLASDTIAAGIGGVASLFGYQGFTPGWGKVHSDAAKTLDDLSNTVYSIPEFETNVTLMVQEDSDLGINALVQNSSLPQSWKTSSQIGTVQDVQMLDYASYYITNKVS